MADDDQRTEFFGSPTAPPEPPSPPPSYGYTPSRGDDLSTEQAGAIAGAPAQGLPDPDLAAAGGPDAAAGTAGPQQLGQEKPRPTRGTIEDYISRSAKMSQEEYDANRARIDPKHQMDDGEAHLRIIANLPDPDKKVAAMQYGADQTDKGVALARAAADAGHMDKVAALLNHAYKYVPAAQGATFDPTDTGVVINTPSGGRYGNPTNLTNDQVNALVHSGSLGFDAVQKNGLQSALQQATKQSVSGEAGLGAGAQGPGSTAPPPDEFGPTKQQVVGSDAGPRDANVPTPEKPGGGSLEGYQDYGPTKQQIAPGYQPKAPAPEAPRPAGGTPSNMHNFPPTRDEKAANPVVVPYMEQALYGQHPRGATNGEIRDIPLGTYNSPYGRMMFGDRGENLSPAERDIVREKYFDKAAQGGSQGAPTPAPQTQDRAAAFDRGAAGGSNPAAAGAQQFRTQTPAGQQTELLRNHMIDEQGRAVPAPWSGSYRQRPSDRQNYGANPSTGEPLTRNEAIAADRAEARVQAGARSAYPEPSGRSLQDLQPKTYSSDPSTPADYHPVGNMPDRSQTSISAGEAQGRMLGRQAGKPATPAEYGHIPGHQGTPARYGPKGNMISEEVPAIPAEVYEKREATPETSGSPIFAPQPQDGGGAGRRLGGQQGLRTDEQGRTAAERGAQETDWRNYYAGLRKDAADGKEIAPKDQNFMRWYEDKIRKESQGGGRQQQQLPNQAVGALKEGIVSTFGNGQKWTLRGGKPVQVQ